MLFSDWLFLLTEGCIKEHEIDAVAYAFFNGKLIRINRTLQGNKQVEVECLVWEATK